MSLIAMGAIRDCGSELVDHPFLFPDLIQSDYPLFNIAGDQVRRDDDITSTAGDFFFNQQDKSPVSKKIQALQNRWKKCVGINWTSYIHVPRVYLS